MRNGIVIFYSLTRLAPKLHAIPFKRKLSIEFSNLFIDISFPNVIQMEMLIVRKKKYMMKITLSECIDARATQRWLASLKRNALNWNGRLDRSRTSISRNDSAVAGSNFYIITTTVNDILRIKSNYHYIFSSTVSNGIFLKIHIRIDRWNVAARQR